MADYPIYRLVKGTQLTFTEMDDNLRWLSQNMSGSQVTITGSTISMTGSVIIDGDLQVYGTASIGFLNTVAFSTGSNQLGNDTLDTQAFFNCPSLTTIEIPACADLGGSCGNNSVFQGTTGNTITLTVLSARMICNGGLPDGDIQYLQANNTVTIVQV